MNLREERELFDKCGKIYESAKVKFKGVESYDVYNCSIPFVWEGKKYIYGRVEKRNEWARSTVVLFEETSKDEFAKVKDSFVYQLEDPYIARVDDLLVMGGTHVRKENGKVQTYYGYFYKGTDINDMYYFTTGPDYMKDIRLVQMPDKRIGVFSRPRGKEIIEKYGSESMVGFRIINTLNELTAEAVATAPLVCNTFGKQEWGGCNQCYMLSSGLIGIIGHKCYNDEENNNSVYLNVAYIFDPNKNEMLNIKVIATRKSYPDGPAKKTNLEDCAFPGGIVMRPDGKADLYSGIGDCEVGRVTIDYPFAGYGEII